ncbi:MAG: hypothetical protein WDN45_04625 [Caulobacteraceae bacterium]
MLAAALASAACDNMAKAERLKLIGGWAPAGTACDSAGGVVYDKEGAWAGYDVSGRWRLDGHRLTTWVTEIGGYDKPARKVEKAKPAASTVVSMSQTDLVLKLEDGSARSLKRCRN